MRVTLNTKPDMLRLWGFDESLAAIGTTGFRNKTLELFQGTN
jgi:hypothetical protein